MEMSNPQGSAMRDPTSPPRRQNHMTRRVDDELQKAVSIFLAHRRQLVKIAYGVLGNLEDAEDVVQEAWIRWQRTDRGVVDNPAAFLATVTIRLAINLLQSARTRHETAAPLLEDVVDPVTTVETAAERTEAVERVLCALLQTLSPAERAAYILRKGFDYPYRQVGEVLQLSTANARQLVCRAHSRLQSSPRRDATSDTRRQLVHAFVVAARAGELTGLENLLAAEISARVA